MKWDANVSAHAREYRLSVMQGKQHGWLATNACNDTHILISPSSTALLTHAHTHTQLQASSKRRRGPSPQSPAIASSSSASNSLQLVDRSIPDIDLQLNIMGAKLKVCLHACVSRQDVC